MIDNLWVAGMVENLSVEAVVSDPQRGCLLVDRSHTDSVQNQWAEA